MATAAAASPVAGEPAPPPPPPALERLELRVERLGLQFRFTFAFHAREVRFEVDRGDGYQRIFPETFSFHSQRHDPAELFIQLDDLLSRPELLSPNANRRDMRELVIRLLSHAPRYLEAMSTRLDAQLPGAARTRFHQDLALFCQIAERFLETRDLVSQRRARVATYLMRKLVYVSLLDLVHGRVEPEYLEAYIRGENDPIDPIDDSSESGFFHTLEQGSAESVNRIVVRLAERAFYLWVVGVCLDQDNQAFEKEDSPFASREQEILRAICSTGSQRIDRGDELVPFLRRPSKDCRRLLVELETFFLRGYDIHHAAALIHQDANLARGVVDGGRSLSWHSPRTHFLALAAMLAPFVGAMFYYDRLPRVFDVLCSTEVAVVHAAAIWFLVYRFCWKRDLTFFHAAVPRIGAGIIVGYLPVFLIDEVWDLASQPVAVLGSVSTFLGLLTLLYIYVEVHRRLQDTAAAFARARSIYVLGALQAFAMGVVMTNLVGRFMVERNWSVELSRFNGSEIEPFIGQLPRIVGVEPLYVFPSAILVMTFLSFFIGIFLQLMWEDLPITEPL